MFILATNYSFRTWREMVNSVADPHRKKADADPGKNLNADPVADSCPY
jgi:hypothetical protein